ncbi:MAG: DUF2138 family protein [Tepidanaerobacter acetatoxydans]|uniref:DUF2138 family protein n=1 Tax=Tepidanaerobacter TaxID=499228 RepID=UPI000AA9E241|nr:MULTISPECIES: DUF2138 family protein [Tepidanaerobacter]NLU10450.1 DUF2138 family protein [Tepidanaerobacter acetatoxydans]
MKNPPTLEFAGNMLAYKDNLKALADSIKDVESQVDDNLQQALIKSSSLIKLSKDIKEIELMSQALEDLPNDYNQLSKKKLLTSLRHMVFESQCMLIKEVQKSLLKAAEAMTDAGNGITLMSNFNTMIKTLDKMNEKVKDT